MERINDLRIEMISQGGYIYQRYSSHFVNCCLPSTLIRWELLLLDVMEWHRLEPDDWQELEKLYKLRFGNNSKE